MLIGSFKASIFSLLLRGNIERQSSNSENRINGSRLVFFQNFQFLGYFCLQDSFYGHYFVIIIEMLTHVNILVYVIISYVHGESICEALDGCVYVSHLNRKRNYYPYGAIISLFVCWNFFCLLQLRDTTYASISLIPLYAEKFIIGLLETQLCLLLYAIKMALAQINGDVTEEVFRREVSKISLCRFKTKNNRVGSCKI